MSNPNSICCFDLIMSRFSIAVPQGGFNLEEMAPPPPPLQVFSNSGSSSGISCNNGIYIPNIISIYLNEMDDIDLLNCNLPIYLSIVYLY